jgi:hypothetical protein
MLALTLLAAASSSHNKSVTVDEYAYLPAGLAILRTGTFDFNEVVPPLAKVLVAAPLLFTDVSLDLTRPATCREAWHCGKKFEIENAASFHTWFRIARTVPLIALLTVLLICWGFSRSLYGPGGGLISLLFACLSPNLLAHGRLVTTDIFLTAAVLGSLWAFDSFARRPAFRNAFGLGLTVGAAILFKFSGLLLLGLYPLIALGSWLRSRGRVGEENPSESSGRRILTWGCFAFALACFVVNCGYLFEGSFTLLGHFEFTSPLFRSLLSVAPSWLPVPFPYHFFHGLDAQLAEQSRNAYLLGEFSPTGFLSYYAVGFLVKTPIPTLALAGLALASRRQILPREWPMVVVGVFSFAFFSIAGHKNIGIRYLLFLVPMMCIWIGRIATASWWNSSKAAKATTTVLGVGVTWLLITSAVSWPHFLPYFNLASGGPGRGHCYLLDSNLDWGQDLLALAEFIRRENIKSVDLAYFGRTPPELYGISYRRLGSRPFGRWAVISANLLWGRMYWINGKAWWPEDRDIFKAYRSLEPVAVLGHTLYVFDMRNRKRREKPACR